MPSTHLIKALSRPRSGEMSMATSQNDPKAPAERNVALCRP